MTIGAIRYFHRMADDDLLPDEVAQWKECEQRIECVLATLPPMEALIVRRKFGLTQRQGRLSHGQSFRDIARELGWCPNRVWQTFHLAMRKLRHPSRSRRLRP